MGKLVGNNYQMKYARYKSMRVLNLDAQGCPPLILSLTRYGRIDDDDG